MVRPADREALEQAVVRGSELLKQGRLDQAQRAFRAALEIDPDNVRVLALLGLTHFRAGELIDARVIYEQLVERTPTDASHRLNLGLVHLKLNDAERAIAALEASRALDPSQGRAVSYLGLAYARGGRYAEAYRSFLIAGQNDLATEIESNLSAAERDRIHLQLGRTPHGPLPPGDPQVVYTPGPAVTVTRAAPGASPTPAISGAARTSAQLGGARTPTPSGIMRAVMPATGRTPTPTEVAHTLAPPTVARTPTPTGIPRTPTPTGIPRTPTPTGIPRAPTPGARTPTPTGLRAAATARIPLPADAPPPAPRTLTPTGVPRTKPPSPPPRRTSRELAVPVLPPEAQEAPEAQAPAETTGARLPVDSGPVDAVPVPDPGARREARVTDSTQFVMPHGDPAAPQQMLDGPSMISRAVASAAPPVLTGTRTRAGGVAPRPLSELATDDLVRPDDGDDAFEIAGNGALILRVTERVLTRLDGVHVTGGDLVYEPAMRRSRGHSTDEAFDYRGSPLHAVTGRGYLIAVPGQHAFNAVMLDDDILYLREDLVFAFQGSLRWENGNVPGLRGRLPIVQFRGDGALVMRLERPLVRIKLSAQGMVFVDAERLAGWIGRVIPRAVVPPAGGPLGAMCVECTGEGIVLLEPRPADPASLPASLAASPSASLAALAASGAVPSPPSASAFPAPIALSDEATRPGDASASAAAPPKEAETETETETETEAMRELAHELRDSL